MNHHMLVRTSRDMEATLSGSMGAMTMASLVRRKDIPSGTLLRTRCLAACTSGHCRISLADQGSGGGR
jgi:hypothetical protein